jgi:hypothetical protein
MLMIMMMIVLMMIVLFALAKKRRPKNRGQLLDQIWAAKRHCSEQHIQNNCTNNRFRSHFLDQVLTPISGYQNGLIRDPAEDQKPVFAYPNVGPETGPQLWGQKLVQHCDRGLQGCIDVAVGKMASQMRAAWSRNHIRESG